MKPHLKGIVQNISINENENHKITKSKQGEIAIPTYPITSVSTCKC